MPFSRIRTNALSEFSSSPNRSVKIRVPDTALKYTYQPLPQRDSIRLLSLLPGSRESLLRCHVEVISLHEAHLYDALSYAWGGVDDSRIIHCDGKMLGIPKNLYECLQRVRSESESRWLWADSICINQEDVKERGHQVRQMAEIYLSANRVLVWLGPENYLNYFGKPEDLDFSALVDTFLGTHEDYGGDGPQRVYPDPTPDIKDIDEETHQFWTGFSLLLRHPWFRRLWVVQEAGLGRSVVALFGGLEVDFDRLMEYNIRAYDYSNGIFATQFNIPYHPSTFRVFPNRSTRQYSIKRVPNQRASLDFLEALCNIEMQLASDPRDYIYALLGHPSAVYQRQPIVTPDYTLSASRLYHEVAAKILLETRNLRALSAVRYNHEYDFHRASPSWAHQWTPNYEWNLGVFEETRVRHDASAGFPESWNLVQSNAILQVHGFVFDIVEELTTTVESDLALPIAEATQFETWSQGPLPDRLQELALILTLGLYYSSGKERTADFSALRLKMWETGLPPRRSLENCGAPISECQVEAQATTCPGDAERFTVRSKASWTKRIFSTADGMLGAGPPVLQKGDLCCVFLGHPVPMLLRPFDSRFKLVGEAFIPRVAQGEAMVDFIISERFSERIFDII